MRTPVMLNTQSYDMAMDFSQAEMERDDKMTV